MLSAINKKYTYWQNHFKSDITLCTRRGVVQKSHVGGTNSFPSLLSPSQP